MPVRDEAAKLAGEIDRAAACDPPRARDRPGPAEDASQGARRPGRAAAGDQHRAGAQLGDRGTARRHGPGPVVLLRGDMDALPVTEETGLPYASAVAGAMHACGHDLHTAMLAGAARLLSARQADLPGTVIFMFQPGEEGCAGARHMIDEGVLDAPAAPGAAFALHVPRTSCRPGCSPPGRARCWPPPTRSRSPCTGAAGTPPSRTGPPTRSRPPARW